MATARVLVVDDEPLLLDSYVRTLRRQGYDVRSAAGSGQALEIVTTQSPIQVALSDVFMPGMRGTELVREIGSLSPETACVLMTAGAVNPAQIPPGIRLFHKPLSKFDLITAIELGIARCAELRAQLREAIELSAQLRAESRELRSERHEILRKCAAAREAHWNPERWKWIPPR